MPIGLTPGFLSRAISRFALIAQMSSGGTFVFASLLVSAAIDSRRCSLTLPNFRSIECHCCESKPLIPAEPDSTLAIFST